MASAPARALPPEQRSDLRALFGPGVALAFGDPRAPWPLALPAEERAIASVVPKRRAEFRAGRALVRLASAELGAPPLTIPAGADRAPQWPAGWTGSISHCADLCGAAVARAGDGILSLGLDIEPAEPLDVNLIPFIARAEEQALLEGDDALLRARMLFGAKECAYKAQYPLSGAMLEFDDLHVTFETGGPWFTARFMRGVGPFAQGDAIAGFCVQDGAHVISGAVLRTGEGGDR
ncbi:4'-phosphopantetheinyl transferase superfamily protein [Aureimonas sp. ME7]|uniref:4'-phosphopantetheinyl transferase family protein n=1 Tax=Aureimonas sp. ME7 TaxID=2744252 RepID=UPI0015F37ABB|nr:4'-phosphopantetheinyl transferase superfamily protein [Aureimonas sp. ME7]